jgi:hypothetical protein
MGALATRATNRRGLGDERDGQQDHDSENPDGSAPSSRHGRSPCDGLRREHWAHVAGLGDDQQAQESESSDDG